MPYLNKALETSIDTVVEYMMKQESQHFKERYFEEHGEFVQYDKFLELLKEHILYHLIVLDARGKKQDIQLYISGLYNDIFEDELNEQEDNEKN